MKFLHTSDLHLGLRLCELRLNEDIAHLLDEIAALARERGVRAVLLAGDLYDRANPTPESVAILDSFITALAADGIAVLAIAGNHDAPERVAYLGELLTKAGVHLSPCYDGTMRTVSFPDEGVAFHLLPFLRPSIVRLTCPDFDSTRTADAVRYALRDVNTADGMRHVLLCHQFVAGNDEADAPDTVGGTESVPVSVFDGFDYVALGHLHGAHAVGRETVRYSGSPLKCSFSEADDAKSVTLVELTEDAVTVTPLPLHPLRDLREMRGSYEEMTAPAARESGNADDYLRITLTDEEDIPDVMAKLRVLYPNLLRLTYDNTRTRACRVIADDLSDDPTEEALTPLAVFAELYELQNNAPPDATVLSLTEALFAAVEVDR